MELLAPVGSFSSFDAALDEGADAVYVGAPGLNARALSKDFTYPEIGAMIRRAHASGVKFYLAANSLVKEGEVGRAVESLAHLESLKPDALIIQDLGLFYLAGKYFPGLDLHASTLMLAHNSLTVKHFVGLGFTRVVVPRELTIKEIRSLSLKTGAELEVFVHGAMCFSYSGLCLFSSLHGGKSSLRGRCVQPCRRQYTWQKKKGRSRGRQAVAKGGGYLFSMNDLNAIEQLTALSRAGVVSLKIEGRLKSGEYVRKTVRAYRLMIDSLKKSVPEQKKVFSKASRLLDEAMGRRRSTGFFLSSRPEQATTPHLSGNVGLMVGKVQRLETISRSGSKPVSVLTVVLRHAVQVGDRLRLHNEKTGDRTNFTLQSLQLGQHKVSEGKSGQKVKISFYQKNPGKSAKEFHGLLFRVDVSTGRQDEKRSRNKLLKSTDKESRPNVNKIKTILNSFSARSKYTASHGEKKRREALQWWVKVGSFRDMGFRLPVQPAKYILPLSRENVDDGLKLFRRYHASIVWSLTPIILEDNLNWYSQVLSSLVRKGYQGFQLGHFSQSALFDGLEEDLRPIHIYGDYTCNILNHLSLQQMKEMGFAGAQFSIETDGDNLAAALSDFGHPPQRGKDGGPFLVGMYVYGRPPLFTARLDNAAFRYGKRFVSPKGEEYVLSRQDDTTIARSVIPFDLLDMPRKLVRMGVDYLLVDLSEGSMKRNVSEFITHYSQKGRRPAGMVGNFSKNLA